MQAEIPPERSLGHYLAAFRHDKSWRCIPDFLAIEKNKKHRLLDVGAGLIWFETLLAPEMPACMFIAFDSSMPRLAKSKKSSSVRNVFFAQGLAEALPFSTGSFDSVLILNALEHFGSAEHALGECFRVLRPEGKAFFTAPNRFGRGHADSEYYGPAREFSYFELKGMLSKIGFDFRFVPPQIPETKNPLKAALFRVFVSSGLWKIFKPGAFRVVLAKPGDCGARHRQVTNLMV
ncbi:MAG: class I SAM-dependent methyltransferase [Candidatus Diapherotrites archaeon]